MHKNLREFAVAFVLMLFLTSCLPKEEALPTGDSNQGSISLYGDFKGLAATETVGATKVKLTWKASESPSIVAYNIYDATFRFNPKLIKTVNAPISEITLTGLATQSFYTFRVRAADDKGQEDSNVIDLPAIPYGGVQAAQIQSATSAIIPFNDGSNAEAILVYCRLKSASTWDLMMTLSDVSKTQASLTDLTSGAQYVCRVALKINGYEDNNTVTTTFTPMGSASQLAFTTQPGSTTAGSLLTPQPVVTIQDVNGNTVSAGPDANAIITIAIATTSSTTGSLQGGQASVAAVKGVATFTGLTIPEAGLKILSASKVDTSGLSFGSKAMSQDSNPFTISAGNVSAATSEIALSSGPLIANGNASYTVTIKLKDSYGNAVPGILPTFVSSNTNDSLVQSTKATDATGTATGALSTIVVEPNNGNRTISIATPSGLTSKTATATFIPGPASQLAFSQQPQTSPAGAGGMSSNIIVAFQDANGNLVASTDSAANATVNMVISYAPTTGVLMGTTSVAAVNGLATFSGLGIDVMGNNYKIRATAPDFLTLAPATSNPFNITTASPTKIAFSSGPSSLMASTSGSTPSVCGTYTIQLQDSAGNTANALDTVALSLTSTGGAIFYNSSTCSGSPISSLSILKNKNTVTISLRDPVAQNLTITASGPGLTAATKSISVTPSQFVLSGGPVAAKSGTCSPGITLTTQGTNGVAGSVLTDTIFSVSFLINGAPTSATAYSDSECNQPLGGTSPVNLTVFTGFSSASIYFKDDKAEGPITISVGAQNGMTNATLLPSFQTVNFLASSLSLTSPTTPLVAGGSCIGPFTVMAKDANGDTVTTAANTLSFTVSGGTTTHAFYTSTGCSSPVTSLTLTSGTAQFFLKDTQVETLTLSVSDTTAAPLTMASTTQKTISVWPYKLAFSISGSQSLNTGPLPATTNIANICLPITISSQYSSGTNVAPLSSVNISLSGAGVFKKTGGAYYSDAVCTSKITQKTLAANTSSATIYFMSLSPGSFTLSAVDAAGILASTSSLSTAITAETAWLGSRAEGPSVNNDYSYTFTQGNKAVIPRINGPRGSYKLHFNSAKTELYSVDYSGNAVFKYDYANSKYKGWIGAFNGGSSRNEPPITDGALGCMNLTAYAEPTPGWCIGGSSTSHAYAQTYGGLYSPSDLTDDGTNLYVLNYDGDTVNMYDMATGAFKGWIGYIRTTATPTTYKPAYVQTSIGPGVGLANNCATATADSVTPGFCFGGGNGNSYLNLSSALANYGDGRMWAPRAILWANNYLYIANSGAILRYKATPGAADHGAFAGWIGKVINDPSLVPSSCQSGTATFNAQTPSWCYGGKNIPSTPSVIGGINSPTGLWADIANDSLYVVEGSNGTISRYELSTGTFNGLRLAAGLVSPFQIVSNALAGTLFVADWQRIIKLDNQATGVTGWFGKVNSSPSSPAACTNLLQYDNTPGWCGGSSALSMAGLDEKSLNTATAIENDGNGYILTGQRNFPSIKKWREDTGEYVGQLSMKDTSPSQWVTSSEVASLGGYEDASMNAPAGSVVVTDGATQESFLYLVEKDSSRIKKIRTATGEVVGWIGGILSKPTGGDSVCTQTGVSPMAASPGWCLGSYPNPNYLWSNSINIINQTASGVMYSPSAITADNTYLYVTDLSFHRVHRYKISDGLYGGWIGWISSITGMTCTGGTPSSGSFTPGWCTGGSSTANSSGNGGFNYPTGIWYSGGNLYVVDFRNYRVSNYVASSGAFNGWIGKMGTNLASCALNTANTHTKGWCSGSGATFSTAAEALRNGDPGGGFAFYYNGYNFYENISGDTTYLYVTNVQNNRIDRFWLSDDAGHVSGEYADSLRVQSKLGVDWTSAPGAWGDYAWNAPTYIYPTGIYVDAAAGYLYYSSGQTHIQKRRISDGAFMGWMGAVAPGNNPSTCTPSGAMTFTTPGWCQGGNHYSGYTIKQFVNANYISGDANYIYVSDMATHRVTRLPK